MQQSAKQQSESKETVQLVNRCWNGSVSDTQARTRALEVLASAMSHDLSAMAQAAYLAVLSRLSKDEFILAVARAIDRCKFFPKPVELLEFAGMAPKPVSDESEALTHLTYLLGLMRSHGTRLRPILGPILNDGKDAEGRILQVPERGPSTPCPELPSRTEITLAILGGGDRFVGLGIVGEHPEASEPTSTNEFAPQRRQQVERAWLRVWQQSAMKINIMELQ